MRKVLHFLFAFVLLSSTAAVAQTYTAVTHLSGTQTVATTSVTVTPINSPNSGTFCSAGPYQIGKTQANGYNYKFNGDITHARIRFTRLHDDDTMTVKVNSNGAINVPAVAPYAGCTQTTNNVFSNGIQVTTTGGKTGPGQDGEIILSITPNTINEIEISHIRHQDNIFASDIYYSLEIADDSCTLGFFATIDSPQCSGRDIQLDVTDVPNTTFSWTYNGGGSPTFSPSANVRDPKLVNVNATHSGEYIVTGTRGTCTYKDTVNMLVTQSPAVGPQGFPPLTQLGPFCPGEYDTIKAPNPLLPNGGKIYIYDSFGLILDSFNAVYEYPMDLVQPIDGHRYYVYAVSTTGCISDTVAFDFEVNPGITANFEFDLYEGCLEDTVVFNDTSISSNDTVTTWNWRFGDGSTSILEDPTHYYQVPKPDDQQRTYNVQLIVTNGYCNDTIDKDVVINHPIFVEFDIDDDSICQGDTITFTNNSFAKPGTQPYWQWDYGDGTEGDTTYNTGHRYYRSGVFTPTLYIEDFRGCTDSFSRTIVVDSAGGIFFTASDTLICAGDEVIFLGDFSAAGYNSIDWDFDDGMTLPAEEKVFHSYPEPGTYNVRFSADYRICPDTFFERTITVKPYPKVFIGDDTTICPNGAPILLTANVRNVANPTDVKYLWNNRNEDAVQQIYVRGPGEYAVRAELDGCSANDTIVVKKDCYIDIPNVFTPNGDGSNDYFLPRQLLSKSVTEFTMQIYNRWGEIVFETNTLNGRGWDGKYGGDDQPNGVYIYTIGVTFANGITERYQGNVTLVR